MYCLVLDCLFSVEYKDTMSERELIPLHDPRAIRSAVRRMAAAIDGDADGKPLTVVGVLKGSVFFLADLLRALESPVSLDFVRLASYGAGVVPGDLRFINDVELPLRGRRVLIVDDIVDTGQTALFLKRHLRRKRPRSCRLCTLLDKPSRRVARIDPDYTGFVIPDVFVVGYGLDMNEQYRQLPGLYSIAPSTAATGRRKHG